MLSGGSWVGRDWEVVQTPAGPTIRWDAAWTAPGTENVSSVPPRADTFIDAAAPADTSAGVAPILYVGRSDRQGASSESQGLLQFDVSDFSHDVAQATVTLYPGAWRSGSDTQAAEAIFDHAWDEATTWETQPEMTPASPIARLSGEATWTIANGDATPIRLDVTQQIRRTVRRGDLNFDGVRGAAGVFGDVAAFELAVRRPVAFDTAFTPAIVDDRDLLDRADLNDDGVINRDDAPRFLAAHGFLPGDLDFDGTVGLNDLSRLQRRIGQDADYTQGDVDFSGSVDRHDVALLMANFGQSPPAAAEDTLSIRIYATDNVPDESPYVGYVSKDNLSMPDQHPRLDVIQRVADRYEQVTFGPTWQIDPAPQGAAPTHQAIGIDGAGTSVHVWWTHTGPTPSIIAQRFDDRGNPLGERFTVVSGEGVMDVRVATAASGDFIIAWRAPDVTGSSAVFYRRYHMVGTDPVAGATVRVTDSDPSTSNRFASVTLHDDGTVAFAWQGATVSGSGQTDVYFRAFDADDQPAAAHPVIVPDTVLTGDRQPAQSGGGIAALPGKRFAVVWTDGRQLRLRRFDADGTAVAGSEAIAGSAGTGDGPLIGSATVVSSAAGDLWVAWRQQSPGGQPGGLPETTIRMRRFDAASGSWQTLTTLVDFHAPFWQSDVDAVDVDGLRIAADPFGALGVVWQQSRAGLPDTSLLEWFSRDGQPITAPTLVSISGPAQATALATGVGGRFLVGWTANGAIHTRVIRLPWRPPAEIAAPTLRDVPEPRVELGGSLAVELDARYPGGTLDDVVIQLAGGNPAGVSLVADPVQAGRAVLHWDPPDGTPEGLHLIQLDVADTANPDRRSRVALPVIVGTPNLAPILAAVDRQQALSGAPFVLQIEATDPDAPDFDLRYRLGSDAPHGARINRVTGLLQWEPTQADVGTHALEITVADQGRPNLAATGTVTIDVLPTNIGPTITAPATVPIDEDLPFQFTGEGTSLRVDDTDSEGTPLQLTIVASDGRFTLENTDGLQFVAGEAITEPTDLLTLRGPAVALNGALDGLIFQPNADFRGVAELRLELSDLGNGGAQPAQFASHIVSIPVAPAPDAPTLAPQTFYLRSWFAPLDVAGAVVAGNPDPDQLLRYEITAGASDGALAIDVVTGTITVADAAQLSPGDVRVLTTRVFYAAAPTLYAEAPITVHIEPDTNRGPSIGWDTYTLSEDDTIAGNLMLGDPQGGVLDTDADGDPLVLVEARDQQGDALPLGPANRLPSGATLTVHADGRFTYDASSSSGFNEKYQGTSHDQFSYTVADSHGSRRTATVNLTIQHVNDLHAVEDVTLAVRPAAKFHDRVGRIDVVHAEPQETLTYAIGAGDPEGVFSIDNSGEIHVLTETALVAGEEYNLQIDVVDQAARTVTATATVRVVDNRAPRAIDQQYRTAEDVPLVGNVLLDDTTGAGRSLDPDPGQTLTVHAVDGRPIDEATFVTLASGARVQVHADGSFLYDPSGSANLNRLGAGEVVTESISLTVRDPLGSEDQARLLIDVQGRDDAPIARDNAYEITSFKRLTDNVLTGLGPGGTDSDPDASDALRLSAVDGVAVTGTTTLFTRAGATLTVEQDGSFVYDPVTMAALADLDAGVRFHDAFVYTVRDTRGRVSNTAVAEVTIVVDRPRATAGIDVVSMTLLDDTGPVANDFRTDDPRLRGRLDGVLLDAHHFEVEFDVDAAAGAGGFAAVPTGDVVITLDATDAGFPDFQYDPRTSSRFSTEPGRKVVAYRVRAFDSAGQQIVHDVVGENGIVISTPAQSPWQYFDFELLDPPDQGPIRVAEDVRLYDDTGAIDEENPGLVNSDQRSNDPRLYGVIGGDFTDRSVRIEFEYSRDGATYSGQVERAEAGSFVYDPRVSDPGLADQTVLLTVDYRMVVVDTTGSFPDRTLVKDSIVFTHTAAPPSNASVALAEETGNRPGYLGTSRSIVGTVSGTEQDEVFVEFDHADASGLFDQLPDGEVTAVRQATASDQFEFRYLAQGLPGISPQVRARVREWNAEEGMYLYGNWSNALVLSPPTLPAIARFESETVLIGGRSRPQLVGYLAGAVADSGATDPHDLTDVGLITIEFFHHNDPLTDTTPVDGTAVTDPQGSFEYLPRGLAYGVTFVQARTVLTLPGTTEKIYGPVVSTTVLFAQPHAPTLAADDFGLMAPEAAEEQYLDGRYRWVTDDPRVTGTLTPDDHDGIAVDAVRIEFAHDDQAVAGDEEQVAGYAQADEHGDFFYRPFGLSTGNIRLRARIAYDDDLAGGPVPPGPWVDLYLRLETPRNALATVEDLRLADWVDDGSGGPPRTTHPRITGHVEDVEGYRRSVTVEFRERTTETLLGTATTDAVGDFVFVPADLPPGTYSIEARAHDWDYQAEQVVVGPWTAPADALNFVIDTPTPLEVIDFDLYSDTGASQDDRLTANGLLVGHVGGDGSVENVTIALDWAADGTVDATVPSDAMGQFSIQPDALQYGPHTVRASVASWDPRTSTFVYSTGRVTSFTFEQQPNAAAKIVQFALAQTPDPGTPVRDPTLVGRVINESTLAGITIEVDFDTDDLNGFNQSTTTDALGHFRLLPSSLPVGTATVRARTRETDATDGQVLLSDWVALPGFDYEPPDGLTPSLTDFDLTFAPDDPGPPPATADPQVSGHVAIDGPLTGVVVEFSRSENGPVVGSAVPSSFDGSFHFDPPDLVPADVVTLWARAKKPSGADPSLFLYSHSLATTFLFVPVGLTGLHIVGLALRTDTSTPGGSSGDDGSTSDSRITGTIDGINQLDGQRVQFDVDRDGTAETTATTGTDGAFEVDLGLSTPGYYSIRARVEYPDRFATSAWQAINFVFDTNDSSPQALALVAAFAAIDPDWQTADQGFDHAGAVSLAEATYQNSLDQANSNYDFQLAVAKLARRSDQLAADGAYQQGRAGAERSYQEAIHNAHADFAAAIGTLPAVDRFTYALDDFVWPDPPGGGGLIIPDDATQPQPPPTPTYDGPSFDAARDPIYRATTAQAQQTYFLAVKAARQQYRQDVDASYDLRDADLETAREAYQQAVDEATDRYDANQQDRPEFDHDAFQEEVDRIRRAWRTYRDTVRGNNERYASVAASARQELSDRLNSTYDAEIDAKQRANDSAQDAHDNHEGGWTFGEDRDLKLEIYRIDKRYAAIYEKILNQHAETIENASREQATANAQSLRMALGTVYAAQWSMARISHAFQHEELVDRLDDTRQFTVDLANARTQLQQDTAEAEATRAKRVADAVHIRDNRIADAQREHDQTIADAGRTAVNQWDRAVGTAWSHYQAALAANEQVYARQLAELDHARDLAKHDAARGEAYAKADAAAAREVARADAEHARRIALDETLVQLRVDSDTAYTARDDALSQAWYDQRIALADARTTNALSTADIRADSNIEDAKSWHAYATAMPGTFGIGAYGYGWAYDVWAAGYTSHAPDATWHSDMIVDNEQTREDLTRTWQRQQVTIDRDRILLQEAADATDDLARIDAVVAYRIASNQAMYDATIAVAGVDYSYQTDVAGAQDAYHLATIAADAVYTVDRTQAEAARLDADAAADGNFTTAEASLNQPRQREDAIARKTYEVLEASDYAARVAAWAGAGVTRWETYQLQRAQMEVDAVTARGDAEIARVKGMWAANTQWVLAVARADRRYTSELDGAQGAAVERVEAIGDAYVASAADRPIATFVAAQSAAVEQHDLDVAAANLVFYNVVAEADAGHDRAVSQAVHLRRKALARADYQFTKPEGISQDEWFERIDEAEARYVERGALANASRMTTVAAARRQWTVDVGEINVQLVKDMVAAEQQRAEQTHDALVEMGTAVAVAEWNYVLRETEASQRVTIDTASAEADDQVIGASIDAQYKVLAAAAGSRRSLAETAARGDYEVGLYADYSVATTDLDSQVGTPWTGYQRAIAGHDATWAVARATAHNLHRQAINGIETDRNGAVRNAAIAQAARAAATHRDVAASQSATDRARVANLALADANLSIAKTVADADRIDALTFIQGSSDIAYADAVRKRDLARADAGVAWVRSVAKGEVDAATGEITWQQQQDLRSDADAQRQEARQAADDRFEQATNDTGTDTLDKIGGARIAHRKAIGTATMQHAASAGFVENRHAVASAQTRVDASVQRVVASEQLETERLDADLLRAIATEAEDILQGERLRDAAVTRAAGRADAEVAFRVTQAEQAAGQWQARARANPADVNLRHEAARRAAQAAWFAALGTAYITYQTAVAEGTQQETVDLAIAAADRRTSRMLAETRNQIASGIWTGMRAGKVAVAESSHAVANVRHANGLRNEVTRADQQHALARLQADVRYDQTSDAIDRDDPPATEAQDARDQANFARDAAFAGADFDWRLSIAGAEYQFAVGQASAEAVRSTARAQAEQTFRGQTARSQASRDAAFAKIQGQTWVSETAANNLARESRAVADADFLSAQYAASRAVGQAVIATIPRVSGPTFGIESGYATGQLTFQANFWNGSEDPGEFLIDGTSLVTHGGRTIDLGAINSGIAVDDGATGTGYIMLSTQSLFSRFADHPPRDGASDRLIAVRHAGGQWQYNDDTRNWFAFTPDVGDLLIAEVDFSTDTLVSWEGFSRSAMFASDRAEAKANAWEDVKGDYLQWQRNMSTALASDALERGSAYVVATSDMAAATQTFQLETAATIAQQVLTASAAQRSFAIGLAERTFAYRQRLAVAQRHWAIGRSDPACDASCQTDLNEQRSDGIQVAEDAFQSDYDHINGQRHDAIANAGVTLTGETGNLNVQLASSKASSQSDFALSLADAYYTADAGLEHTLAELQYDYERAEAAAYTAAIDSLAGDRPTPWSQLAQAEAVARRDELVGPVAALARDQRLNLAAADRRVHLQLSAALLDQSLTSVQAHATRDRLLASASLAALGAKPSEAGSVELPAGWTVPDPDLGEVAWLRNNYAVTQPGRISDSWYNASWSWFHTGSYYWPVVGRYDWLWGWDYIVGPYGGFGYSGPWWYGGWNDGYGVFDWNGWSPDYVRVPAGLDTGVDVEGALGDYRQTLADLVSPAAVMQDTLTRDQDPTPSRIDSASGYLALGDANASFGSVAAGFAEANEIASDMIAYSGTVSPRRTASDLRSLSMDLADEILPKNVPDVIIDVSQAGDQQLADTFDIAVRGSRVIYQPVTGRIYNPYGGLTGQYGRETVLGVLDDMGWVQIVHELGGGRATFSSLTKAASQWSSDQRKELVAALGNIEPRHRRTTLQELIDGVRSPYQIDATSNSIGIFIDGTASHLYAVSNVARLYNLYNGTKFFYGGVGNHVDAPLETIDDAVAVVTWETILDRAEADVLQWSRRLGANTIHLFGFSRGAAQAIELADRLGKRGIRVDFLGIFDPVYSVSDPGVTSDYVQPTTRGSAGNYAERRLPDNVEATTVIYAMNETRTFFPATRLVDQDGHDPANVTSVGAPGVHSDIGGHFGNNLNIQQLTLATMVHYAQTQSSVHFSNKPLDAQLRAAYRSTYTAYLAVKGSGKEDMEELFDKFKSAQERWDLLSPTDFRIKASSRDYGDWQPGPVGVQNGTEFWTGKRLHKIGGIAKELVLLEGGELYDEVVYQNSADFIVRDLDWVKLGLWDTYGGIDRRFMLKLYGYLAHPKGGGWRATLGRDEALITTPPQT